MGQQYEKNIGFKTIYTTIIRRFYIFLIIFVPVAIASFFITNFMLTKTYISSATLNRGGVINSTQYSVIQSFVQDTSSDDEKPGAIFTTAENLKDKGVVHSNGNEITVNEIRSGLSYAPLDSNSVYMTIYFQSSDSTVTQNVLNELMSVSVTYLKARTGGDFANLTISSPASSATKNSKEGTYFLIVLAAGFVVSFAIPFIDEIVSDEVYDKYDIESLGCSAFEIKAKSKKKEA